jgi:hypothetical protein
MINPDVDWYGTYVRRSALADYLEILALRGEHLSRESLGDFIRDSNWVRRLSYSVIAPGRPEIAEEVPEEEPIELSEEIDRALLAANDVLAMVEQRASILGERYPFESDEAGRLTYTDGEPAENSYVALLCVAIAHAGGIATPVAPFYVFEDTVTTLLNGRGWPTSNLGERSRSGMSFDEVITSGCVDVGLEAYPERAAYRPAANEEGSDSLTNLWLGDTRPGGIQAVGQVTCAKSDSWKEKLSEPPAGAWREWLGKLRTPTVFLAVPHHVETPMLSYLIGQRNDDVVDRLRIVLFKDGTTDHERDVIESVLGEEVFTP